MTNRGIKYLLRAYLEFFRHIEVLGIAGRVIGLGSILIIVRNVLFFISAWNSGKRYFLVGVLLCGIPRHLQQKKSGSFPLACLNKGLFWNDYQSINKHPG